MLLFLSGIAVLIAGYFTYGKLIEKILKPDSRTTPAIAMADGVDYVILPKWKNMLIQLLNIAGIGPVIGVILGIKFGEIVFIIIPLGCVLMGAVHDFIAGFISIRNNGANLPKIIRENLGDGYYHFFSWFMVILLLLVVAVFINIPAQIIDKTFLPKIPFFWWAVVLIFLYYIVATLFPVDKIIGTVYPLFGGMLLVGSGAIFVMLLIMGFQNPELMTAGDGFRQHMLKAPNAPVIPLLFVTIACGIISGFHATQSPIVARTMKNEKEARGTFYGMMILEGIIAMIWAGAAMLMFNKYPAWMLDSGPNALSKITTYMLGNGMGIITILAVVILAITSGDTALRSTRLSLSEMLNIPQSKIKNRVLICLPMILIVSALLWWSNDDADSFSQLWSYFAWGNQVLAASTLMASTVWLYKQGKQGLVTLLPGMFMTFIVVTFILWTTKALKGQPYGFGLPLWLACTIGCIAAVAAAFFVYIQSKNKIEPGK